MAEQTIIIADDHPLFRGALRQAVSGMDGRQDIVEAGDFEAARLAADQHPDADVLLLDLAMPGVSGFSGLMALRAEFSSLPIIICSATDDCATIRRSLELG
ncbi:response regulator, partial [Agrobacterium vitis]